MTNDEEIREHWLRLSWALDASWSSLLDLGGALDALQKLGIRSSQFPSPKSLNELIAPRQRLFEEVENFLTSKERWIKNWCDTVARSQRELAKAEMTLRGELEEMPPQLLLMLSELRRFPWRAHFRRFYFDQLRDLPQVDLPVSQVFIDEDGLEPVHRSVSVFAGLPILLERAEQLPPYMHWQLLIRRGRKYAADLYSIRGEVGGSMPDGPVEFLRWRLNGKLIEEKMSSLGWRLVNFLWSRRNHSASFEECAEPVFGDRNAIVDGNRIGSHIRDATQFFKVQDIPFEVHRKKGYVYLERRE